LCLDLVEATPEELAKRQLRSKMKEEYLAALSHEGKNTDLTFLKINF
jgi:hypothetical protein